MKRDLPDDLARLGLYLEVAAGETLRRRQRRQAMANFVGAVAMAVPFALAVAAADLAPADGLFPPRPQPQPVTLGGQPSVNAFTARHLRDELRPPTKKDPCVDAQNCPAPLKISIQPAAAGKR